MENNSQAYKSIDSLFGKTTPTVPNAGPKAPTWSDEIKAAQTQTTKPKTPSNPMEALTSGPLLNIGKKISEEVPDALPTIGGIVGGIGGGIAGAAGGPVGVYAGAVGGSTAGGALGELGRQKLKGQKISGKEVVESAAEQGAYEAIGGPLASAAGKALKVTGKSLYKLAIPTSEMEAKAIINSRKSTNVFDRLFGKVPEVSTAANTAFEKEFAGRRSDIAVQAVREADNLFENVVRPELKASPVNINKDTFFESVLERIKKDNPYDLTKQKAQAKALEAVKKDYKDITHFNLEDFQGLKQALTQNIPEKYWKGENISGNINNLRAEISNEARSIIRSNVTPETLKAYDDYGNLLALKELGIQSLKGEQIKGNPLNFIAALKDMVVTPIATIGGHTIYKTGSGIQFSGPAGAKTLGHVLGLDGSNSDSTNPYNN